MFKQGLLLILIASFLLAGCSSFGGRKSAGFPQGHEKYELNK